MRKFQRRASPPSPRVAGATLAPLLSLGDNSHDPRDPPGEPVLIAVTSAQAGEGKTGVAAAIARSYAYEGKPVRLVRMAGEGNAAADAAWFGSLFFVPGSSTATATETPADPEEGVVVVECSVAEAKALAASGAKVVLVSKGKSAASRDLPGAIQVVTRSTGPVGDGIYGLPEDRTLNGFSLSEAQALSGAETIVEGDKGDPTCDHLVIAPISSDAGQPYFRRFEAMAVVVRFDKTDMHLAALAAQPEALILTGGRRPSDYLFDAANARGVPVLLSRVDTENTVIALEPVFDNTRFQGERKLDRMAELLASSGVIAALS